MEYTENKEYLIEMRNMKVEIKISRVFWKWS